MLTYIFHQTFDFHSFFSIVIVSYLGLPKYLWDRLIILLGVRTAFLFTQSMYLIVPEKSNLIGDQFVRLCTFRVRRRTSNKIQPG